jgi:hypothetical protein
MQQVGLTAAAFMARLGEQAKEMSDRRVDERCVGGLQL